MLSHKVVSRQNVGEVVHYYEDGVDDYYTKQGDGSVWQGKGAEALGLRGKVDASRFHELLRGQVDPAARSSRAATRRDSHNRLALDLTFSAPKSVSLQALVHGDPRIVRAHDLAVAHALEVAERLAEARQKTARQRAASSEPRTSSSRSSATRRAAPRIRSSTPTPS